jgi:hypothetical protein
LAEISTMPIVLVPIKMLGDVQLGRIAAGHPVLQAPRSQAHDRRAVGAVLPG